MDWFGVLEHRMLTPSHSFNPTPHRGVACVHTLRLHTTATPPQGDLTQVLGAVKLSIRLPLVVLAALVSELALAESDLPKGAMSIGGVSIGATQAEVISVFGEPSQRPEITEKERLYDSKFVYPDATAYFVDGRLDYLQSTRKGMCTATNICPGTPAAEVRKQIGCNARNSKTKRESLSCFDTETACSIVILLHNGKAKSLRLECLP
jgi:hypothetical protein